MGYPRVTPTPFPRVLFCSYHGYSDPSSGAAQATRALFELLTERGWACGVLSGPDLDFERGRPVPDVLAGLDLAPAVERPYGDVPHAFAGPSHGGEMYVTTRPTGG